MLVVICDKSGLPLIHVAVREKLLFDEHERAQDIFMLVIGKIVDMHIINIMSHFIIQHVLTSLMIDFPVGLFQC